MAANNRSGGPGRGGRGRDDKRGALVVVGDGKGMVGVGHGKAKEVQSAIQKGVEEAKKNFFKVPMVGEDVAPKAMVETMRGGGQ